LERQQGAEKRKLSFAVADARSAAATTEISGFLGAALFAASKKSA